jgi:hypothetical protein
MCMCVHEWERKKGGGKFAYSEWFTWLRAKKEILVFIYWFAPRSKSGMHATRPNRASLYFLSIDLWELSCRNALMKLFIS